VLHTENRAVELGLLRLFELGSLLLSFFRQRFTERGGRVLGFLQDASFVLAVAVFFGHPPDPLSDSNLAIPPHRQCQRPKAIRSKMLPDH